MQHSTRPIPFAPPSFGPEEKQELIDVLESGWITRGPKTEQFEQAFAAYCQADYIVGVSSGTAALHLSLLASGVGPGDEVIVPVLTFAATAHAVRYVGATPVFVDCNFHTLNISARHIEQQISYRTKAIIVMHYGGQVCSMDAILKMADKHQLAVIEDAAHAVGAEYEGRRVGGLGSDFTCFSFYATKSMTTGDGGMIASGDKEKIDRVRRLSMHGRTWSREHNWDYDVEELGYKYNMTDLQAALGIHQLRRLDASIEHRTHIAQCYNSAFRDIHDLYIPEMVDHRRHAWHLYPLRINPRSDVTRADVLNRLKTLHIGAGVLWKPLNMQPYYRRLLGPAAFDFHNARKVYRMLVNLPIHPGMSDDDVSRVVDAITGLYR